MSDNTTIEWTDATWNPITGCSVVSAGCTNCYAMRLAGGRLRNHPSRAGLTRVTGGKAVWTGDVRFNQEWLDAPLRWRRPRMIFVCAHGDLFHENVPDEWIDQVFAVMVLAPWHTFQVLTKRPERMRTYLHGLEATLAGPGFIDSSIARATRRVSIQFGHPLPQNAPLNWIVEDGFPRRNVWLGVSVEDQATADERIPILLDTPAAVRWISAEPLLGPIHIGNTWLDWVVAGGESGPRARPSHPDWFRGLRDQCKAAGVAFNFKQWGAWVTEDQSPLDIVLPGESHLPWAGPNGLGEDQTSVYRVGKTAAGRELDGVIHDDYPQTRRHP